MAALPVRWQAPARWVPASVQQLNRSRNVFSRSNVQLNKGQIPLRTSSGPASSPWLSPFPACQRPACGVSLNAAPLSTRPRWLCSPLRPSWARCQPAGACRGWPWAAGRHGGTCGAGRPGGAEESCRACPRAVGAPGSWCRCAARPRSCGTWRCARRSCLGRQTCPSPKGCQRLCWRRCCLWSSSADSKGFSSNCVTGERSSSSG